MKLKTKNYIGIVKGNEISYITSYELNAVHNGVKQDWYTREDAGKEAVPFPKSLVDEFLFYLCESGHHAVIIRAPGFMTLKNKEEREV